MKYFLSKIMSGKKIAQLLLVIVLLLAAASFKVQTANSAINFQINYQGKLTNASYVAVADGTYNMEFKLYDAASGGTTLWTETRTGADKVQVTNGLFSVMLGSVSALTSVDFNQTVYLGVNIGGTGSPGWDGEMTPRKVIGAVPAAMVSNSVEGTGKVDITNTTSPQASFAYDASNKLTVGVASNGMTTLTVAGSGRGFNFSNGNVGVGATTPASLLHVKSAGGLNSGIRLESTSSGSYSTIDFYTPSGLSGQFVSSGASFSNGLIGGDQTVLANELPNGALQMGALGTNGYVTLFSGGLSPSNERLRVTATGNVGIGDTSPAALLTVGSGDLFQVNSSGAIAAATGVTSSGTITFSGLGGGGTQCVQTSNTGVLSAAACGGGSIAWSSITAPSGNLSLAHGANTTAFTFNSLTTGTALSLSSSSLSSGALLDLTVTGTAGLTNQKGLNISLSGANGTGAQTTYGGYFSNTHTGTSTNVGLYSTASGGSNNYAAIFSGGNVGIGTSAPGAKLDIDASGGEAIRLTGNGTNNGYIQLRSAQNTFGSYGLDYDGSLDATRLYTYNGRQLTLGSFTFNRGAYTSRLYIDGTGQVGIANTAPSALFSVGSSSQFQVNSSGAIAAVTGITNTGVQSTTVQSATALTVARTGTTYALQVDTNTASSATGLKVTAAAAGGGLALTTLSSGTDENLTLDAKGAGTIHINGTATGDILLGGGSSSTGCTVTNSTGALACTAGITGTTLNATTALQVGGADINTAGTLTNVAYLNQANIFSANQTITKADPSLVLNVTTATDTDFWLGVQDDADGVDDDLFQIGDGTTPGTNPFLTINTSGNLGIGSTSPAAMLHVLGTSEQSRLGYDANNYLSTTVASNGDTLFDFTSGTNAIATYKFDEKTSGAMINFDTNTRAFAVGGIKVDYSHGGIVTGRTEFKINPSTYVLSLTPSLGSSVLNEIFSINGTDRKMGLSTGTSSPPTNYTGLVIDNRNLSANSTAAIQFLSGSYSVTSSITHELLSVSTSALYFSTMAGEGARLDGGNNFGIGTGSTVSARLHVISTTEQLRIGYNTSNYWTNTIGSSGGLTMQGVGTGGSLTIQPTAGQGLNINLSTTGDFAVNTNQLYVDTSSGNVGLGDTSPAALLTVGSGDLFQVNSSGAIAAATGITSSGTITFSGLGGGGTQCVQTSNTGVLSAAACGGAVAWSAITAPSGNLSLAHGANTTAFTFNSVTTGTAYALSSTSLSSGIILDIGSNGTAGLTNQTGLNISLQGTNSNSAQTTYGAKISNTHAGTTSTNIGLQLTASGGTSNNYALITTAGSVGIGDTSPASLLTVGSGDLFQVNSSGQIGALIAPTSDYIFSMAATTANDNSRVLSITQANDSAEDSYGIHVASTQSLGTITSASSRTIRGIYNSVAPTVTVGPGGTMVTIGTDSTVSSNGITMGNSSGSINSALSYGSRSSVDGTVVFNNASPGDTVSYSAYGIDASANFNTTLTNPQDSIAYAVGGKFTAGIASAGNANFFSSARGIEVYSMGNLQTTGTTEHYGGYFSTSGSADVNYGLLVTVSDATTNYSGIFNGGKFGIGTYTPSQGMLVVAQTDAANDEAIYIDTEESTTTQTVFAIESDTSNGSGADTLKFKITADGSVYSDSNTYSTPADIAEMYNVIGSVEAGDVVMIGEKSGFLNGEKYGVKKFEPNSAVAALGVVSTKPGPVLGYEWKRPDIVAQQKAIALAGRVPIKVSNENGAIKAGDFLTTSKTVPGVATKATTAGQVIGQALENYNQNAVGKIDAFIKPTSYDGAHIETQIAGLEFSYNENVDQVTDSSEQILESLMNNLDQINNDSLSQIVTDLLIANAEVIVPQITTSSLHADSLTSATSSGGIVVESAVALNGGLTVDTIGSIGDLITFQNNVEFIGIPYLNADTAGFAVITPGAQTVDVIFTNEYVVQPVVAANMTFEQVAGGQTSEADQKAQAIAAAQAFMQGDIKYLVVNKSSKGFTIVLNKPATSEIKFSWTAFAVKNANTFTSIEVDDILSNDSANSSEDDVSTLESETITETNPETQLNPDPQPSAEPTTQENLTASEPEPIIEP